VAGICHEEVPARWFSILSQFDEDARGRDTWLAFARSIVAVPTMPSRTTSEIRP
jgi:hypothetical protein